MSDKDCTAPVRKLRYALGVLLAWIFPISVVFGLGIYVNGWGATLAIFGIVLLFVGVVSLGLYLMMGEGGTQMSDKETAPWMFQAAHRGIEYLSAATGCLKGKTHGEATRLENELAQIIAKHAVECTAPAPWAKKVTAEMGWDKGWADSKASDTATPQVTPELEIEQEADGRWLAAYTRFPGVAAYGASKEEAIRNAAKVLIESEPQGAPTPGNTTIASGLVWYQANVLKQTHKFAGASEQASPTPREFKPYMEDHEYYDPPQTPPTPEQSRNTGVSLDGGKTIHSKFKND